MSALTHALSAALVDFLWQGALVGTALWIVLVALRNQSANVRYVVSCVALFVLVLLPALTIAALWMAYTNSPLAPPPALPASPALPALTAPALSPPQTMLQIWFVPETPRLLWLDAVQRWALPLWSIGVLLLSIRLGLGWRHSRAIQRGASATDEAVMTTVADLAARIGVTQRVRVRVSSSADGPSVVGWLRPMILLPPAAAIGLTPQQLEAVLAHELAHVRRHDYLVNMFQIVAETMFFYHPVVWWVSNQIRIERELCCDDVAVRSCGDAVGYARALTTLARQRLSAPELAMAATGGSLKFRIQRLIGAAPRELGPSGAPGAIVLAIAIAALVLNIDRLQARAQSPSPESPRFEVASIKRNTLNDRIVVSQAQNGRVMLRGHTLGMLIQSAYQLQDFQVIGGPAWIETDRFDIQATEPALDPASAAGPVAPGPGQPRPRDLMLRALLEERFNLSVHKETRERPVYALVPARSDGRLGAALKPTAGDCATAKGTESCGTTVGPGYIRVRGVTMAQLATAFSRLGMTGSSLNRLVVDRSGLEGRYDAELKYTPENIPDLGPNPPAFLPAIDPNGPSIFTAVQEQLGLKLDPQRGPVEVLVVDRVERPTEN